MSDTKGGPQGTRSGSFMAAILEIGSWIFDDETSGKEKPDETPPGPEVKGGGKNPGQ